MMRTFKKLMNQGAWPCALILFFSCNICAAQPVVQVGIDVLAARQFDVVRGKRVGLITNQTGRTGDGRATIDVLKSAPGVKLIALFAPEHGVRGEAAAGAHVKSYR